MEGENPEIKAVPISSNLTGKLFPPPLLLIFQNITEGREYPALSYFLRIISIAERFSPSSMHWLNSISERISILVGISDSGIECFTACFRMRSKTDSRLVDIPQSADLSWTYRSRRSPDNFCKAGFSLNVMK